MKKIILVLFFVGVLAFTLLIGWMLALFIFVMGDSPHYGAVAYIPKWVFAFSIFTVFYRSRPVKRFLEKAEKKFF